MKSCSFSKIILLCTILSTDYSFSQGLQSEVPLGTTTAAWGFLEYLPPSYLSNPNKYYPLIIHLSGYGERGDGSINNLQFLKRNGPPKLIAQGKWPVKNKQGNPPSEEFIVISPQSPSGFYNNDKLYVLINLIKNRHRVDNSRIYLTGLSAGAFSVWYFIDKYPNVAAAVIPIAGNGTSVTANACNYKNVPTWAFHGDADGTVGVNGSINPVTAMNACTPQGNPRAKLTIYNGVAHDSWTRTFDLTGMAKYDPIYDPFDESIYDWLLRYKNSSLIVNGGPDIVLYLPSNSTTITGSASTSTGSISSYSWTKVSGPAVTITNASNPTVSLTNMVEGVYTFRLTATNSGGENSFDEVKITVIQTNQSPIANAGPDLTLTLPTNSVALNGTGSDTDGTITSYAWVQVSGPAATTGQQNAANLILSSLVQGTYVFSLTVTDNNGATSTDNATLIVNGAATNQTPVANAGVDKTLNLPTNSTVLTGSGSDPDGTIATYLWVKVSGPAATLTNASTSTLSLSGLVAGSYVFRLTVTDNLGATANDQATVTVIAANQAPVANAGSAITITLPTSSTNIVGSGSDADGSIATYVWTQVTGPNTATLTNAASPTVTTSNLIQGVYTFRLTVTDNLGATGFANVTVTVNAAPVNVAPTANAGADQTITLPTNSVVLVGSGNDPDGTIATYNWTLFSGPAATLTGQTTATLTASNLVAGTYVFRLTVTDNQSAIGFDNIIVTVQPAAVNQSPLVDVGPDFSLTLPANSTPISATASDPDGSISTYLWTKISGPAATLGGSTTATLSVSGMVAGNYQFRLTVTDNLGATASDDIIIIVASVNQSPVVVASNDETITLPTSSTNLIAVASDPDGTIASYLWTNLSSPATPTMGGTATSSLAVSGLIAGTYIFRILVTDNNGATAFDDVIVIVQSATNISPTASAGVDKSITLPTSSNNFTGSGSDPDGTITNYTWTQINGVALTLANGNTSTLTVSGAIAGTFTFRLTVTDNNGATGSDDVVLTVNSAAVNQAPAASAGTNQNITLPQNTLNLTGSGSDSDGSIASYLWVKVSGPAVTLTNASNATVSLSNLLEGTYLFRLTVTDNGGLTASADVTITVLPAAVNQLPVANGGVDITITLPSNSTTLFGGASDADGSIASYSWTKLTGPTATLTNATTPTLSLSDLMQGVYVFRLTVTDDDGATDNDDVTVTVNAVATNQAPIANAGPDKLINLPTNSTNLSGSGSDADGSITTYAWAKVSGPTVTIGASNIATLSISNLVEGIYIFQLEVTDDDGATDTDNVTITVNPSIVNQSPIVSAGADKTIFLPVNTVQFSGSASDPDGSIASQIWTQVSGPTSATLTNSTTPNLMVSNLIEGIYRFRLTATDNSGASALAEALVTVNASTINQPPTANAGPDVSIQLPANSTSLNGSGTDPDGSIASFAWTKISGPSAVMTNSNTSTLLLSSMVEGFYTFQLTVTDNSGANSFDLVILTVLPTSINFPPTVDAGEDIVIELPINTVKLTGKVSDDGTIISFLWTKQSGPSATLTGSSSLSVVINDLSEGEYVFRLAVTDNGGLISFDDVSVLVLPTQIIIPPPQVDAGGPITIKLPIDSLNVTVSTKSEGLIISYFWTQLGGPIVPLIPDTTAVLNLKNLIQGDYFFNVKVTDNENQTATDDLLVIVEKPPVQPDNTFSPNNDGFYDTWKINNSELLTGCDVIVFDRQGKKVFQSVGYETEWTGNYHGQTLPSGAYFFTIRCNGQKNLTGSVTLIR